MPDFETYLEVANRWRVAVYEGKFGPEVQKLTSPANGDVDSRNIELIVNRVLSVIGLDAVPTIQNFADAEVYLRPQLVKFAWPSASPAPAPAPVAPPAPVHVETPAERERRLQPSYIPYDQKQKQLAHGTMASDLRKLFQGRFDKNSFEAELSTAQSITVPGYGGNINWAATNAAREAAVAKVKEKFAAKFPGQVDAVQAATTHSVFVPLPLNATQAQMLAATPAQLKDLLRRQHEAKLANRAA